MDAEGIHMIERKDLHPNWVEVMIVYKVGDQRCEAAPSPGTRFMVGKLVLECIEYPMPGTPFMAKVVDDNNLHIPDALKYTLTNEPKAGLLTKYSQDEKPFSMLGWMQKSFMRFLWRKT